MYEKALLNNYVHRVEMNSLQANKEREMVRTKYMKTGLTDISLKYFVHSDRISCTPFQKDKKYI